MQNEAKNQGCNPRRPVNGLSAEQNKPSLSASGRILFYATFAERVPLLRIKCRYRNAMSSLRQLYIHFAPVTSGSSVSYSHIGCVAVIRTAKEALKTKWGDSPCIWFSLQACQDRRSNEVLAFCLRFGQCQNEEQAREGALVKKELCQAI